MVESIQVLSRMNAKVYNVDIDVMKHVIGCKHVIEDSIRWRVSASGLGFHVEWRCSKKFCQTCEVNQQRFDDPIRYMLDNAFREPNKRRILWDSKGGRPAGPWTKVTIPKRKKSA